MYDPIIAVLTGLLKQYGPDLAKDPPRLKALLNDLAGGHPLEIRLLFIAAEENIPGELMAVHQPAANKLAQARLVKKLEDEVGVAPANTPKIRTSLVCAFCHIEVVDKCWKGVYHLLECFMRLYAMPDRLAEVLSINRNCLRPMYAKVCPTNAACMMCCHTCCMCAQEIPGCGCGLASFC